MKGRVGEGEIKRQKITCLPAGRKLKDKSKVWGN
jgi:hypothetical protein